MHSEEVTTLYDSLGEVHRELKVTVYLSDLRTRVGVDILNTISKEVDEKEIKEKLVLKPVSVFFIDLGVK